MANTVTIDERDGEVILHVKYGESICSDCHTRQLVDSLNKELDAWRKKASALEDERDDLKAKLEATANECYKCTHEGRLAAAERCIYEIDALHPLTPMTTVFKKIRHYREKRGGAK